MGSLQRFDIDGESADQFFLAYWDGLEDQVDDEVLDPAVNLFPVNPVPDQLVNSFAVRYPARTQIPSGVRTPHLVLSDGLDSFALWFFPPVQPGRKSERTGKPSGYNAFIMVRHMYETVLDGARVDNFPSPYFYPESAQWRAVSSADSLTAMRKDLMAEGRWAPMPPEFMARGGASMSEAKKRAARQNLVAARRERAALAQARYEQVHKAHAAGMSLAEIAAEHGLTSEAARKLLERALRAQGGAERELT